MTKIYDYIYIGSGPITLIDACIQKRKGAQVIIIDDRERIGGAWGTINVEDYGNIEIGCHIWSYNKEVYSFLEKFFGLNLVEMNPQPIFLWKGKEIPYDRKMFVQTIKTLGASLLKGQFSNMVEFIRKSPAFRLPLISKPYKYLKGGAREFQQSMKTLLEKEEVEHFLSTKVEKIHKTIDGWELSLNNNSQLKTRKVILTSTSNFGEISSFERKLKINKKKVDWTHYHLFVKGERINKFSYIRVLNHPFIHRLSDATDQLEENKNDIKVYLVGVYENEFTQGISPDKISVEILEYLKQTSQLSKQSTLLKYYKNTYSSVFISLDERNKMATFDSDLELLHTTDLIYGIHNKLKDWKSI